jgi:hypothetical protein
MMRIGRTTQSRGECGTQREKVSGGIQEDFSNHLGEQPGAREEVPISSKLVEVRVA